MIPAHDGPYNRRTLIRVFIVAPTPALRAGLRAMLAEADFIAAGESPGIDAAGPEARDADAFLLSAGGPLSGLVPHIADDHRQAVVALSDDPGAVDALRALPLRGWCIIPPDATPDELNAALRMAVLGWVSLPPRLLGAAVERWRSAAPGRTVGEALEQPLTPRELEVLERVSRGLPSKLIAHELDVSESTVKFHLSSIYAKLGVASRTEAVSRAAHLGLITL